VSRLLFIASNATLAHRTVIKSDILTHLYRLLGPAEPHDGSTTKEVIKDGREAIARTKKSCVYGSGILFCSNPDEEDEDVLQYLSDLEQLFLEWFGD